MRIEEVSRLAPKLNHGNIDIILIVYSCFHPIIYAFWRMELFLSIKSLSQLILLLLLLLLIRASGSFNLAHTACLMMLDLLGLQSTWLLLKELIVFSIHGLELLLV